MEHLLGKRILVTRAADDNGPWVERLISLGADPVPLPCISIERLQLKEGWRALLDEVSWVAFTSHRSVTLFADLLGEGHLASQQIAAVGPSTAAACKDRLGRCDLLPPQGTGAALAESLKPKVAPGGIVLLPGAAEPRPELAMELESAGIKSASLPLYATHPTRTRGDRVDLFRQRVDAALFASPSAVTGCFASAEVPLGLPAGCIGPTTAAAARSAGLSNVYTSKTRDLDGLLTALHDPLASNPQTS